MNEKDDSGDGSRSRSQSESVTISPPRAISSHQVPHQRQHGFQFVNLEGAPRRDAAARKLVKSHVARHMLLKQRERTPGECASKGRRIHKVEGEEMDEEIIPEQPIWPPTDIYTIDLGSDQIDPFGPMPIPNRPYIQDLVRHFGSIFALSLSPLGGKIPMVAELYPVAMTDPMLFHALLSVTAAHQSCLVGRKEPSTKAIKHRGHAIHMLNGTLRSQDLNLDDVMIATVLLLAVHDVFFGDIIAIESHLQGLELMIRIRGGVRTLGMEGALTDLLYWIDHACAFLTGSRPHFPLIAPGSILEKERFRLDYSLPPAVPIHHTGFGCLAAEGVISLEFGRLLEMVIFLTNRLKDGMATSVHNREPCRFHDTRAHIDEILHAAKDYDLSRSGEADIQECIRLAASIYSNMCFRDIPPASAIHSHLVDQLKLALVRSKLSSTWAGYRDVLIWVLFMGGAVTTDQDSRLWILGLLKPICDQLGLADWGHVRESLRNFLWVDEFCEGPCKNLWMQMVHPLPLDPLS
ncbi:hypothetical protein B7463_g31, partial [Scytalidium lignicola]